PTAYLESIGFWGPPSDRQNTRTIAAHGVWVNDEDVAILKRRGIGVSHNPESNMKLSSGTAPVAMYLAAGVALGLGTDGAASNNDRRRQGAHERPADENAGSRCGHCRREQTRGARQRSGGTVAGCWWLVAGCPSRQPQPQPSVPSPQHPLHELMPPPFGRMTALR